MDQIAQFSVVTTIGDCPLKRRIGALTEEATRFARRLFAFRVSALHTGREVQGDVQGFSAHAAIRPLEWAKREYTGLTNGKPGNSNQGGTTDTAISGEESEE
jgi:hypothetical protein